MKLARIAIPAGLLAVLAFIFAWRSCVDPAPPRSSREKPSSKHPPSRHETPRTTHEDRNPQDEPPGEGSLRIFIHERGTGLGGVKVEVIPKRSCKGMTFETPANGRRTLAGMPAGEYLIGAQHPGYVPAGAYTTVNPSEAVDLSLELYRGGRIRGKITNTHGTPLEGAHVRLLDPRKKFFIRTLPTVQTDTLGTYVIENVPIGEYGIHFDHPRYVRQQRMGLRMSAPGEILEADALLEAGTTVAGRVLDPTGTPIEGASVMAINEQSRTTRSNKEGRFTLSGLGGKPVNVSAGAAGHSAVYFYGIAPDTMDIEFTLPKEALVKGRISASSIPEKFVVNLLDAEKEYVVVSDIFDTSSGDAFIVTRIPPGTYRVHVEATDYETLDRPLVMVQAGQTVEGLVIRLARQSNP